MNHETSRPRQDERLSGAPAVPPAFAARTCAPRSRAALTGGPGPVHRPLTGGTSLVVVAGLPAVARFSGDVGRTKRVPIDAFSFRHRTSCAGPGEVEQVEVHDDARRTAFGVEADVDRIATIADRRSRNTRGSSRASGSNSVARYSCATDESKIRSFRSIHALSSSSNSARSLIAALDRRDRRGTAVNGDEAPIFPAHGWRVREHEAREGNGVEVLVAVARERGVRRIGARLDGQNRVARARTGTPRRSRGPRQEDLPDVQVLGHLVVGVREAPRCPAGAFPASAGTRAPGPSLPADQATGSSHPAWR